MKVFVSHSSKDEVIVKSFVEDILRLGLSIECSEIFCTTTDGTKIESGEDWRSRIKDELETAKVIILLITPNYKESEVCMCEMGAAWVTDAKVLPYIVDPITYNSVGIVQEPKQIENLVAEKSLDKLRDIIERELDIPRGKIKTDLWTTKRTEFITKVGLHLENNHFLAPLSREEFDIVLEKNLALKKSYESLIKEHEKAKAQIEDLKKAKNKEEVDEIEKKYMDTNLMDELKSLCAKAKKNLSSMHPIIIGIIFTEYSGVPVRGRDYRGELDEAIADGFITNDDHTPDWTTTSEMRNISESLHAISNFLDIATQEKSFYEDFDKEYGFYPNKKLENRQFWKYAIGVDVYLS